MHKLPFYLLILFFLPQNVHAQQELNYIHQAHLTKWKNSSEFMLECMELMPADKYKYQPTEDEMPFDKLCIHIIQNMVWLSEDYLLGNDFENPHKDENIEKDALIELMTRAMAYSYESLENCPPHLWQTKVDFFAGEMPLIKIIHLLHDHATHHRGQLSVYLRLNGIKPPRYVGW